MHRIDIGKRLLQLRQYIGVSRNSLAKISDIPAITIKSWEAGISEIRPNNLKKYLSVLEQFGCYTTDEWVMHGYGQSPYPQRQYSDILTQDSVNIANIISLLSKTSNLFYYLDINEYVLHIDHSLLFLLGGNIEPNAKISQEIKLQELCSQEIYELCHKNLTLCLERQERKFHYVIQSPYSKTSHIVDVLYHPLIKHKSNQVLGVLCFISKTMTRETE